MSFKLLFLTLRNRQFYMLLKNKPRGLRIGVCLFVLIWVTGCLAIPLEPDKHMKTGSRRFYVRARTLAKQKPMIIGELIKEELRKQSRSNQWLADQIKCHPRTINKIFKKSVIDTDQLLRISKALNKNFFNIYADILDKKSRDPK